MFLEPHMQVEELRPGEQYLFFFRHSNGKVNDRKSSSPAVKCCQMLHKCTLPILLLLLFLNQDSKIGNFIFLSGKEYGETNMIYVDH